MRKITTEEAIQWWIDAAKFDRIQFMESLDEEMFATPFMDIGTIHDQKNAWVLHVI